jgi:UDP-N-acetyl-D-glucosamine dehydrogenase
MRTLNYRTRFIELAGEINAAMPEYWVARVVDRLNEQGRAARGSTVLVLGVAYKKDIDDLRESPALDIIKLLQDRGADVVFHDPYCAVIADDKHTPIRGLPMSSVPLDEKELKTADVVVVVTDHTKTDYAQVARLAKLVVDTRGVMRKVSGKARVVGLSNGSGVAAPAAH